MKRVYNWYTNLSQQVQDSITISIAVVGLISTILSILGISLGDWKCSNIWMRIGVVFVFFVVIYIGVYCAIGRIFRDSVNFIIRQTSISISCGDIFQASGWKIIGCDTHFDTRVDDIVISKKSLHGQLVLNHGKKEEIEAVKNNTANAQKVAAQIQELLDEITDLRDNLSQQYNRCLADYGKDFMSIPREQQIQLGALVNNTKALAASLGKNIQ